MIKENLDLGKIWMNIEISYSLNYFKSGMMYFKSLNSII